VAIPCSLFAAAVNVSHDRADGKNFSRFQIINLRNLLPEFTQRSYSVHQSLTSVAYKSALHKNSCKQPNDEMHS